MEIVGKPMQLTAALGVVSELEVWWANVSRLSKKLLDPHLDSGHTLHLMPKQSTAEKFTLHTTVAVPLNQLRNWMVGAVNAATPDKSPPPTLGHAAAFLRRVLTNCRADYMPETYCGFLALAGHVARTVASSNDDAMARIMRIGGRAKYIFDRAYLPERLPLLCRSNLGEAWLYVRDFVAKAFPALSPKLPALLVQHMKAILVGDLPAGIATLLYPMKVNIYNLQGEALFDRFRDLHPELPATTAAFVAWLSQNHSHWVAIQPSHRLVRLPPTPVSRWLQGLLEGKDLLSDRDSELAPLVIFKSMGAWSVGPSGVIHLENRRGDFKGMSSVLKQEWSMKETLSQYRDFLKTHQGILNAPSEKKQRITLRKDDSRTKKMI